MAKAPKKTTAAKPKDLVRDTPVRLLVSRAGSNFSQARGDVIKVTADEAARMIEAGQAEIAVPASAPETASGETPAENAAGPSAPETAQKLV